MGFAGRERGVTMRIRTYTELSQIETLEERFRYLSTRSLIGDRTFGGERFLNQRFYKSAQWLRARQFVIARDLGCDLGVEGYEIFDRPIIHHMNPMSVEQISNGDPDILDPELLITCSHRTHNAIHYGDESQLPRIFVERRPGDTKLW
jgi:hypothetical protein